MVGQISKLGCNPPFERFSIHPAQERAMCKKVARIARVTRGSSRITRAHSGDDSVILFYLEGVLVRNYLQKGRVTKIKQSQGQK